MVRVEGVVLHKSVGGSTFINMYKLEPLFILKPVQRPFIPVPTAQMSQHLTTVTLNAIKCHKSLSPLGRVMGQDFAAHFEEIRHCCTPSPVTLKSSLSLSGRSKYWVKSTNMESSSVVDCPT